MSIIKKPSELAPKSTISCLIYGQPGLGKSTLGCSAPNAVLFDYDGGVQRINGAHQVPTVQVSSWEDTQEALREIAEEMPECQTIVIDTVGKMLDYMSQHIIANDYKMGQRDGSLSLKGYGVRKNMFISFIKQLSIMGKNVVFIAHEREEKRGEETVKRPEIGGSSANDLIKELDLVGYMQAIGKDRTISFDPTESYYAKNTCNLPSVVKIPNLFDANGEPVAPNNFLVSTLATYQGYQINARKKAKEFDKLVATIDEDVNAAETADDLNGLVKTYSAKSYAHIYNSKIVASQKLNARAKALGLKYDTKAKSYVQA